MKKILTILFFSMLTTLFAQSKATNLVVEGNQWHREATFDQAEAAYRKSLSIRNNNPTAQHNLGNTHYRSKDYDQANQRFFQTQKNSTDKGKRHAAFHNMGNGFMQQKAYEKAVEAYKNALRNNPADEETRYNYALAKELLEKQKQEQEKEQQDNQDQQQDQDQNNQDQNQDNKDNDQEGNQKEKPSDKDKDGDKNKDKDQDKKGDQDKKEGDQDKKENNQNPEQKPNNPNKKPGQISPEQIKSLLDAMNQQEKNVQDKVNAKKAKGVPVKKKKDW